CEEWSQAIATALAGAAACVVMISRASVARKNVRDEVGFALDRGKPVIAVHLAQTELPPGLELRLGQVQAILRWQLDEQAYARQLERALGLYGAAGADSTATGQAGATFDVTPGGRPSARAGDLPGRVADRLAVAVGRQWHAEAAIRRLNDPYPLPVRWVAADPALVDDWQTLVTLAASGAGWPQRP